MKILIAALVLVLAGCSTIRGEQYANKPVESTEVISTAETLLRIIFVVLP
jgi:uncharacterized protein YceK